jgi:hypothetical protein
VGSPQPAKRMKKNSCLVFRSVVSPNSLGSSWGMPLAKALFLNKIQEAMEMTFESVDRTRFDSGDCL